MIIVVGGIKGGVGKTTLATNLAIMRAAAGSDLLLVDGDSQNSASDFSILRQDSEREVPTYTAIKLSGAAIRSEVLRLKPKYEDIVIDVGGKDTAGQRAALSIADICLMPFSPSSYDFWALEQVAQIVEEARAFNEGLRVFCLLNRADSVGKDNDDAAELAKELEGIDYLPTAIANRKAFRNAASQGLGVAEIKPKDKKAIAEVTALYQVVFDAN